MIWVILGLALAGLAVIIVFLVKVSTRLNNQLNSLREEFTNQLKDNVALLQNTHKTVGDRLDNATRIFGNVATSLGQLTEASKRILEVGRDISSLQELLRAPKFRGEIGETMLENILSQVLPKDHYKLQYRFKTGNTVDAVVELGGHFVPVDSKFSYENFKKMLEAANDVEKNSFHKKFIADIKSRIDEIAAKYILPDENTFDFALMYIYAENVYYETIIKEDLLNYAVSKKVIPVSPNTFYAYLRVICLGLKGLKIESKAQNIIASLGRLQGDLGKFQEDFRLVGNHLRNAGLKYEDAEKKLEKFSDKLINVHESNQENLLTKDGSSGG